MNEDDVLETFRGVADNTLKLPKHVTLEVGPDLNSMWAFRVTVHPFRNKREALVGVEKMKALLRSMGFTFKGDKQ